MLHKWTLSSAVVDLSKWLAIMEVKFVLYARAKHEESFTRKENCYMKWALVISSNNETIVPTKTNSITLLVTFFFTGPFVWSKVLVLWGSISCLESSVINVTSKKSSATILIRTYVLKELSIFQNSHYTMSLRLRRENTYFYWI